MKLSDLSRLASCILMAAGSAHSNDDSDSAFVACPATKQGREALATAIADQNDMLAHASNLNDPERATLLRTFANLRSSAALGAKLVELALSLVLANKPIAGKQLLEAVRADDWWSVVPWKLVEMSQIKGGSRALVIPGVKSAARALVPRRTQ